MSEYDEIEKALTYLDKSSRMLAFVSIDDDTWKFIDECRDVLRSAYRILEQEKQEKTEDKDTKEVGKKVELAGGLNKYPSLEWNPDISKASPIVIGTRVTASLVAETVKQGWSYEDVTHRHRALTLDDVRQCVAWSKENE